MKKILIESHVPFVPADAFDGVADTVVVDPRDITNEYLKDIDGMIVRTRTKCNCELLHDTPVSFVATATIGIDHIDTDYCESQGIEWASAPGCNAPAVAQYVWRAIMQLRPRDWQGLTLGVVGVGHVGSIVVDWARRFGVEVLACDAPRERRDGGWNANHSFMAGDMPFVSLAEVAEKADIITFHTPHTKCGADATHHLVNREFLGKIARCPLIINAARGPIVDTTALIEAIRGGKLSGTVIDTWAGEPQLNRELLGLVDIATPHIAGYSLQGKLRATEATVNAALRHFGSARHINLLPVDRGEISNSGGACEDSRWARVTPEAVVASYDIMADDAMLRSNPSEFECLRDTYPLRNEVGMG